MTTIDEVERATTAAVERFGNALNRHDVAAIMAAMTDDCIFENTAPRPDGTRYEGQSAVRAYWERWVLTNPDARFDTEELIVSGDRAVLRWIYRKTRDGKPWHLRGVDVLKVHDGKVAEKLAYVKG